MAPQLRGIGPGRIQEIQNPGEMSRVSLAQLWLCLLSASKATGKGLMSLAALAHRRPCERWTTKGCEWGVGACSLWLCLSPFLLPFCRWTDCQAGCSAHLSASFERKALQEGVLLGLKESRVKRRADGKHFVLRCMLHLWWGCEEPHGPCWNTLMKTASKDTDAFWTNFWKLSNFSLPLGSYQVASSKKQPHCAASLNFALWGLGDARDTCWDKAFPTRLYKAAEVLRARGSNPKLSVNVGFRPLTPPSFGQAIGQVPNFHHLPLMLEKSALHFEVVLIKACQRAKRQPMCSY